AYNGTSSSSNLFVLKLNSSGVYQWNTFYGTGFGDDAVVATGIALDGSGNVYVTGTSEADWYVPNTVTPIPPLNPLGTLAAPRLFVLKLNSSGVYQWHTFYGNGAGTGDVANGIAVDAVSGNVSATGYSFGNWSGPAPKDTPSLNPFVITTTGASN